MARFVTLDGEHGFWVRNSFFDVWLAVLALHIERTEQNDSPEAKIAHKWLFAAKHGLAELYLAMEDLFSTEGKELEVARSAVASLRDALNRLPDHVHTDAFALLGFGTDWSFGSVPKREWLGLTAAFADLLEGKISAKAGDKMDVVGEYAGLSAGATPAVH